MFIKVEQLSKEFKVYEKKAGLRNSVYSLFFKKHKQIRALNNISFTIENKNIIGLIGPNGAGKTTILKILSGILYPTAGNVNINNYNPWNRKYEFLKQIGFVMRQKRQLWWDLPAMDSFNLLIDIYELDNIATKKFIMNVSEELDVIDILERPIRNLSLGQRMKLEIIAAIIHKPSILFLDEPTIGLDILATNRIREFIRNHNTNMESIIILSSHNVRDIEFLCNRILLINKGNLVVNESFKKFYSKFGQKKIIQIEFSQIIDEKKLLNRKNIIERNKNIVKWEIDKSKVNEIINFYITKYKINDIEIKELPIETILENLYKNNEYAL